MKFIEKFFQLMSKKKFVSIFVLIFGLCMFLVGFYAIPPVLMIKGYITVIGLILSFYGFINILT